MKNLQGLVGHFTAAFIAVCLCLCTLQVQAARLALVVGNDDYQNVERLKNAVNDAGLMAGTLRKAGFDVGEHLNLNRNRLYDVIDAFQKRIGKGDEVVFYFSGHGVQLDNDPMLLPIDILANDDRKLRREALPLLYVQDAVKDARVSLLVIDACRDNPFPRQGTRTIGETRGLKPPDVVKGQAVILSAGRNQKALDTVPGEPGQRNGLFTHEFVRVIATPGLDVRSALNKIRDEVEDKAAKANHQQRPSLIDDLRGNFYLMASLKPEPSTTNQAAQADPELEAWDLTKRRDTVAAYQAYINSHPTGRYAGTARVAIEGLQPTLVAARRIVTSTPAVPSTIICSYCPEMVEIPAGSFMMGSNGRYVDEMPLHRVEIGRFELGRYEVTQGQWRAVMGSNPSAFSSCHDGCPVEKVSWNDIHEYIQKLNQKTGLQYRLPSEAEWEYAARGGTRSNYWWGDDIGRNNANCDGCGSKWDNKTTAPVGQFNPNGFGLYDLNGNVWEWVQDYWHADYSLAPTDASAWETGKEQMYRVLRGGSWNSIPTSLRSAIRVRYSPDVRYETIGFRLARDVP